MKLWKGPQSSDGQAGRQSVVEMSCLKLLPQFSNYETCYIQFVSEQKERDETLY